MARPPIPLGSWGEISRWPVATDAKGKPTKYKAQARFRDADGHLRPVSAYGKTRTAAERALLKKLQDRARTGHSDGLTAMHKIGVLIDRSPTERGDPHAQRRRPAAARRHRDRRQSGKPARPLVLRPALRRPRPMAPARIRVLRPASLRDHRPGDGGVLAQ
jgi:hypothetical protein